MKYILTLIMLFTLMNLNAQQKAPNFKLENLNGEYVEMKNLLGKGPVLISFWATWCKPCMEELEKYKSINSEFKDKGLTVIAVSTDDEKTVAKVKPLVKSKQFNFTVLLDTNSDVARKFYVQNVPHTFLLDKKGTIVYSHLGYKNGDELQVRNKIEGMLSSSDKTSD